MTISYVMVDLIIHASLASTGAQVLLEAPCVIWPIMYKFIATLLKLVKP